MSGQCLFDLFLSEQVVRDSLICYHTQNESVKLA